MKIRRLKVAIGFNISSWKNFISEFVECDILIRCPDNKIFNFTMMLLIKLFSFLIKGKIVFWGGEVNNKSHFLYACEIFKIPVLRIEDGFLRSKGLGLKKTRPFSLIVDSKGIYYDSRKKSDLESILLNYNFKSDFNLRKASNKSIETIISKSLTKYILDESVFSGEKGFILVVGQVVDDLSVKFGNPLGISDLDLLKYAIQESSGKQVLYRPHPDVMSGNRQGFHDIEEYKKISGIYQGSLPDALSNCSKVYTITSIVGFEALIRGIPVVTFGQPFYSGWGVSDDRCPLKRRNRNLDVVNIFSAAYFLYPIYLDANGNTIDGNIDIAEEFLYFLDSQNECNPSEK